MCNFSLLVCACRCGRSPWLRARGKLQYGIHGDGWWVSFPSSLPLLGTKLTQPTGGLRWCGTLQALPSARGTTSCWHSGLLVCLRGSQETAGSWQDQSAGESYLQVRMNTKILVLLGSGPVRHLLFRTERNTCDNLFSSLHGKVRESCPSVGLLQLLCCSRLRLTEYGHLDCYLMTETGPVSKMCSV